MKKNSISSNVLDILVDLVAAFVICENPNDSKECFKGLSELEKKLKSHKQAIQSHMRIISSVDHFDPRAEPSYKDEIEC